LNTDREPRFAVVDRRTQQVTPLTPHHPVEQGSTPPDTTALRWATDGARVWFATSASNVLEYDITSHTLRSLSDLPDDWLAPTAMAYALGSLWLAGSASTDERDRSILLRYDSADARWESYESEYAPLPSGVIRHLASASGQLWLAADEGVARLDAASHAWDTRWLSRIDHTDSSTYELVDSQPDDDAIGTSIDTVLAKFGLAPTTERIRLMRRADPVPLLRFTAHILGRYTGRSDDDPIEELPAWAVGALAQPVLEPLAREVVNRPRVAGDDRMRRIALRSLELTSGR
jgi:hypothetical protein